VVTDGVLERREGRRMLEEQGVIDALGGLGDLSAQAVAERLRRLVADFAPTPQTDDLAVLVVKAGPAR
jgi:serine phosphatase RsbU (regulator of sigma subunit)